LLGFMSLLTIFVLSACATNDETTPEENSDSMEEGKDDSTMGQDMEGHMDHDYEENLNNSTGENEIEIPPVLESDKEDKVAYTVRAQKSETEIFNGTKTKTYGYNGAFLGPMRRLNKGDKVKIKTVNELDEETTFHWHGLEVPGEADGGPHESLKPGEEKLIEF